MRVLVPGGAGYIGSFTVRALQEAGHEVVVYDNLSYGHREAVDGEIVVADLADAAALDACLSGGAFDAIVHFAAFIEAGDSMKDAARFFQNNTANTIHLLNAAARGGVRHFVFSSTAAVYADGVPPPINESAPTVPANVYGETKLLVERMLPWYDLIYGIKSVSLRYFNAAGAALDGSMGQDHEPASHLVTASIKAALGEAHFILFGDDYPTPDGTCIRDYIHVLDLSSAHVVALDHLAAGGASDIYNVGAGKGHSNWEVIETVKRISGINFSVEIGPRRPGDAVELVADSSKLQRTLGWKPEYSDLDAIVGSAWEWHRTHPHGYESYSANRRDALSTG